MKAGSGKQSVLAARPKLQANFSDVVAWLEPKPGKWIVNSCGMPCRGHYALEARVVGSRQVLPHNRVIDHCRHARNAIGQDSLDPVGCVGLLYVCGKVLIRLRCLWGSGLNTTDSG